MHAEFLFFCLVQLRHGDTSVPALETVCMHARMRAWYQMLRFFFIRCDGSITMNARTAAVVARAVVVALSSAASPAFYAERWPSLFVFLCGTAIYGTTNDSHYPHISISSAFLCPFVCLLCCTMVVVVCLFVCLCACVCLSVRFFSLGVFDRIWSDWIGLDAATGTSTPSTCICSEPGPS